MAEKKKPVYNDSQVTPKQRKKKVVNPSEAEMLEFIEKRKLNPKLKAPTSRVATELDKPGGRITAKKQKVSAGATEISKREQRSLGFQVTPGKRVIRVGRVHAQIGDEGQPPYVPSTELIEDTLNIVPVPKVTLRQPKRLAPPKEIIPEVSLDSWKKQWDESFVSKIVADHVSDNIGPGQKALIQGQPAFIFPSLEPDRIEGNGTSDKLDAVMEAPAAPVPNEGKRNFVSTASNTSAIPQITTLSVQTNTEINNNPETNETAVQTDELVKQAIVAETIISCVQNRNYGSAAVQTDQLNTEEMVDDSKENEIAEYVEKVKTLEQINANLLKTINEREVQLSSVVNGYEAAILNNNTQALAELNRLNEQLKLYSSKEAELASEKEYLLNERVLASNKFEEMKESLESVRKQMSLLEYARYENEFNVARQKLVQEYDNKFAKLQYQSQQHEREVEQTLQKKIAAEQKQVEILKNKIKSKDDLILNLNNRLEEEGFNLIQANAGSAAMENNINNLMALNNTLSRQIASDDQAKKDLQRLVDNLGSRALPILNDLRLTSENQINDVLLAIKNNDMTQSAVMEELKTDFEAENAKTKSTDSNFQGETVEKEQLEPPAVVSVATGTDDQLVNETVSKLSTIITDSTSKSELGQTLIAGPSIPPKKPGGTPGGDGEGPIKMIVQLFSPKLLEKLTSTLSRRFKELTEGLLESSYKQEELQAIAVNIVTPFKLTLPLLKSSNYLKDLRLNNSTLPNIWGPQNLINRPGDIIRPSFEIIDVLESVRQIVEKRTNVSPRLKTKTYKKNEVKRNVKKPRKSRKQK